MDKKKRRICLYCDDVYELMNFFRKKDRYKVDEPKELPVLTIYTKDLKRGRSRVKYRFTTIIKTFHNKIYHP